MPVTAGNKVDTSLDGINLGWHSQGILEEIRCWNLAWYGNLLELGYLSLKSTQKSLWGLAWRNIFLLCLRWMNRIWMHGISLSRGCIRLFGDSKLMLSVITPGIDKAWSSQCQTMLFAYRYLSDWLAEKGQQRLRRVSEDIFLIIIINAFVIFIVWISIICGYAAALSDKLRVSA